MLGIPLTRRVDEPRSVRLGFEVADAVVEGVLERTNDALEVFFCSVAAGGGGRDKEETDGFLRNCSVDAGVRSVDWLPEGLSTGSRDAAGLGLPDGRGIEDVGSMTPAVYWG
jgi:hypothetical protein